MGDMANAADASAGSKIFVGGLANETTIDTFRAYFEAFGAVKDAIIMQGLPVPTKPQPVW